MSECIVKVPQAYEYQLKDNDILREISSVQDYIQKIDFGDEEGVFVVLLRGIYRDIKKKMNTAFAFVNKLNAPIKDLYCRISLSANIENVEIAHMNVSMDHEFMGMIGVNEALLVHFNIPVKGLTESRTFSNKEIKYSVDDIRVVFSEDSHEKNM